MLVPVILAGSLAAPPATPVLRTALFTPLPADLRALFSPPPPTAPVRRLLLPTLLLTPLPRR